ncbi:hypothetical protein ABK040_013724 [Willaertia magna]
MVSTLTQHFSKVTKKKQQFLSLLLFNQQHNALQKRYMSHAFWPKKSAEKRLDELRGTAEGNYQFEKPITEEEKQKVKHYTDNPQFQLPIKIEQFFNKIDKAPDGYGRSGIPRAFLQYAGKKPRGFKYVLALVIVLIGLQIFNHYAWINLLPDVAKELLIVRKELESTFVSDKFLEPKLIQAHEAYVNQMDTTLQILLNTLDGNESLTEHYIKSGVIDKLLDILQESDHPFILLRTFEVLEKCVKLDPNVVSYLVNDKRAIDIFSSKALNIGYEMIQDKRIPSNSILTPMVKILIRLYSERNDWLNDKNLDFIATSLVIPNPKYLSRMGLEILQNIATNQLNAINSATKEDYDNLNSPLHHAVVSNNEEFMKQLKYVMANSANEKVSQEVSLVLQSLEQSHKAYIERTKVNDPIDASPLHDASLKEIMYRKYEMGPKEAIGQVLGVMLIPFTAAWLRSRWLKYGAPIPFIRWTMWRAMAIFSITDLLISPLYTFLFNPAKSDFARNYVEGGKHYDSLFFASVIKNIVTYGLHLQAYAQTYFLVLPYALRQYDSTQYSVLRGFTPFQTFRYYDAYQMVQKYKVFNKKYAEFLEQEKQKRSK